MKIVVSDLDLANLALSEEQLRPRSGGVHVSSIIRHITKTSGIQKESGFDEQDLDQFARIGRLWERVLAEAYYTPPRYERVGEIEEDGIIGSPDALDLHEHAVNEFKVCWQSAKNFEERIKFRLYLWQIKSYLWILRWYRAELDVLFIRGDYTTGVPISRKYLLLFTERELKDNWTMMLNGKKEIENGNRG